MISKDLLSILSVFSPIIPLAIGTFYFSRLKKDGKILTGLMLISLIVQVLAWILSINRTNNQFLYHIYTPVEFIIFCTVYRIYLSDWINKNIFNILSIGFIALSLLNTLFYQPYYTFNSLTSFAENMLLIMMAILFFYRALDTYKVESVEKSAPFWFNTSVLLYYSASLLILGFMQVISLASESTVRYLFSIHSVLNILHYFLFAISLWINRKV